MSATKKMIGAVIVLAAVALVGGSYWTGKNTEKMFRDGMENAAKYGGKLTDYQRGLFSATARTEWTLSSPSGKPLTTVFFNHTIRHGPLSSLTAAARIHSELVLPEEATTQLRESFGSDPFGGKAPLTVESTIGWGGGNQTSFTSPKFDATDKAQTQVSWGGLNGEVTTDTGHSKIKVNAVADGLSAVSPDENRFQIGRFAFQSDMVRAEGYDSIYTGMSRFVLDKFLLRAPDHDGVVNSAALENLRCEGNMGVKDGALNMKVRFDADSGAVESNAQPKITVEKPGVTLLYENLDAKVFDALIKATQKPEGEREKALLVLQDQTGALLRRKPAVAIEDFSARWAEGVTTGNLRIAYTGDGNIVRSSLSDLAVDLQFSSPRVLLLRFLGAMNVAAEESAGTNEDARKNTETLNAMVGSGFLVEKEGVLSIDAHFKNGDLNLNGKEIPPESLLGLLKLR
ncbi:MAG: YdgA family protein [Proteobacteria bacterium]|nr:YdgA family protein [Pseudomonadota bacterium]